MIFSSIEFAVFFPTVLLAILVTQIPALRAKIPDEALLRIRHLILLSASYVFYGWWDWRFCFLMFALTFIAYASAKRLAENPRATAFKFIGVVCPLLILGVFKYFNFFADSFYSLLFISPPPRGDTLNIILPVGISFYTFQSLSYTIDVIRGKERPASFLNVALYISFFPQLVAGPIVRSSDFLPQLGQDRRVTFKNLERGVQIFVFGLFKKLVIADNLAGFVDAVFAAPGAFHTVTVILAIVSYSIQIYFDFSGYSDMAVGCAKCLGYDFARNFNMPYISKNVGEFWKRWHISLSSWLQEYLYIPLGGNRKGARRTYVNLMLTMVLGGLWHGASWNFVVWGALHGAALCVHKIFMKLAPPREPSKAGTFAASLCTYVYVCVCWVFFRAATFQDAFDLLRRAVVKSDGVVHLYSWSFIAIFAVAAGTLTAFRRAGRGAGARAAVDGYYPLLDLSRGLSLFVLFFAIGLILGLAYTGGNPFIYFQF